MNDAPDELGGLRLDFRPGGISVFSHLVLASILTLLLSVFVPWYLAVPIGSMPLILILRTSCRFDVDGIHVRNLIRGSHTDWPSVQSIQPALPPARFFLDNHYVGWTIEVCAKDGSRIPIQALVGKSGPHVARLEDVIRKQKERYAFETSDRLGPLGNRS